MQILNLKPGFEPYGSGTVKIVRSKVFSGGEVDTQIDVRALTPAELLITTRLNSSDDLMDLLMVTNALRERDVEKIHVFFPYVPYARQDRVVREGEAFALRVFADIINAQGFASVRVFDPHSDVTQGVFRRLRIIPNHAFVSRILKDAGDCWLLFPDAGAYKKMPALVAAVPHVERIASCTKMRLEGGEIESVQVSVSDFQGKDVYIVDDICDGGRTFIALAKEIRSRNAGRIHLAISHAILSYGEQPLKDGGVDHVFTTDSFKAIDSTYITQVKLCDIRT